VLPSFEELYDSLVSSDETRQIEAKTSSQMGEATLKTVCAFANEPGNNGGYLLLGVSRTRSPGGIEYEAVGVPDPDKLQADLANQCASSFNEVIRPEIEVHVTATKKRVVVAYIPESESSDKPIYLKKVGLPKGAYRRLGSTDHKCTDSDLAFLYGLRAHGGYDSGAIAGASLSDIDRDAIREYRRARASINPSAEELKLPMPELLKSLGLAVEKKPALVINRAGLLLFGKRAALRRLLQWARIDYVIVSGNEWVPDTKQRYRSVEITAPLMLAIPRLVDLVVQDLPKVIQLRNRKSRRREIPLIPYTVIREAIVNAVMHREYRVHEHSQVIKFSNRLEIRNAGHSLKGTDRLGQPGSVPRNPCIAAVLHETGYAETKGTGILAMRRQMKDANLEAPIFKSSREHDRFDVTLLTHHLLDAETIKWLAKFRSYKLTEADSRAVLLVKEMGYIDNAGYRTLNDVDVLTASVHLRGLRDAGLLKAHGKSTATYYTPTDVLLYGPPTQDASASSPKAGLRLETEASVGRPLELKPDLVSLLRRIGDRTATGHLIEIAVLKLCAIRPISLDELSKYLRREGNYLRKRFLVGMVKRGILQHTHPEVASHPRQAYVTAPLVGDIEIPAEAPKKPRTPKGQQKLSF
jgi:ATP-dependent DNA helicase RecG